MTKYKHSLQGQEITIADTVIDPYDYAPKRRVDLAHVTMLSVGVVIGMFFITGIRACHKPPTPLRDCSSCHNKFTSYFQKNGSKSPEEMAYAILRTKSPRLLASVAVIESGGNPSVRRSGYKKRHDGAFQVNGKYHGIVSHNPVEQALQAERILEELTNEKKSIRTALNAYGGDSQGKYADKILAELSRVP